MGEKTDNKGVSGSDSASMVEKRNVSRETHKVGGN